jgi:hypothetical protein
MVSGQVFAAVGPAANVSGAHDGRRFGVAQVESAKDEIRIGPCSVHGGIENLVLGCVSGVELGNDPAGAGDQDAVCDGEDFRQVG